MNGLKSSSMTAIGHYRLKHSEFQRIVVHIISQILSSLISIVIIPPFQLFGKALLGFDLFIIVIIANLLFVYEIYEGNLILIIA